MKNRTFDGNSMFTDEEFQDYIALTKDEFLEEYPFITEHDYDLQVKYDELPKHMKTMPLKAMLNDIETYCGEEMYNKWCYEHPSHALWQIKWFWVEFVVGVHIPMF